MVIKKYLKIYAKLFKFSIIRETTYHLSFIISILVELGYIAVLIVFFKVIYANIPTIAGWTYYEMLFMLGLNVISSELLLGLTYIFNLKTLPSEIVDGSLDLKLLKPINPLFHVSFARPFFISLIACLPGVYLMIYSAEFLMSNISLLNLMLGSIIFIAGFIIGYSILVIFSSLSFRFLNATTLAAIAECLS